MPTTTTRQPVVIVRAAVLALLAMIVAVAVAIDPGSDAAERSVPDVLVGAGASPQTGDAGAVPLAEGIAAEEPRAYHGVARIAADAALAPATTDDGQAASDDTTEAAAEAAPAATATAAQPSAALAPAEDVVVLMKARVDRNELPEGATGPNPATTFPVTVTCENNATIDGGGTSKTFDIAAGAEVDFDVLWPAGLEQLRCAVSESHEAAGLGNDYDLVAIGDDWGPDNGVITIDDPTDPPVGPSFYVEYLFVGDLTLPVEVRHELEGAPGDRTYPVRITCENGSIIDGEGSTKVFELQANESRIISLTWPRELVQMRCGVSQDLAAAGLADEIELIALGDTWGPDNGVITVDDRSLLPNFDDYFYVINRVIAVVDVPLTIQNTVGGPTFGDLFPIVLTCTDASMVAGGTTQRTFMIPPNESVQATVRWNPDSGPFDCRVETAFGSAGIADDYNVVALDDDQAPSDGRIVGNDADNPPVGHTVVVSSQYNPIPPPCRGIGGYPLPLVNRGGETVGATIPVAPAPGTYTLTLISHDPNHRAGHQPEQENEQWYVEYLDAAGNVLGRSGNTGDLHQLRNHDTFVLGGEVVPAGTAAVRFNHSMLGAQLDSIRPYCASFS